MFIFIYGSKHVPVSTVYCYINYIYTHKLRVTTCAISRHVCVAVQLAAFACEVSPKSVYLRNCYIC